VTFPRTSEEASERDEKPSVPDLLVQLTNHKTACLLRISEIFPLLLENSLFRGAPVLVLSAKFSV